MELWLFGSGVLVEILRPSVFLSNESWAQRRAEMGDDVFLSYLYCKYKGYLTLKGEKGELSEYGLLQAELRQSYRDAATSAIICNNRQSLIRENSPLSIGDLK